MIYNDYATWRFAKSSCCFNTQKYFVDAMSYSFKDFDMSCSTMSCPTFRHFQNGQILEFCGELRSGSAVPT